MIWTILIFLTVLSVLVLVHEWGHYFTAKKVEEFGLGFPPRIWSWKGKDGMLWTLNLIPLGGFVKIKGESGAERLEKDSFASKKIWQRLLVLVAGVVMNLVTAGVLFGIILAIGAPTILEGELPAHAEVREEQVLVQEVLPESGAEQAGLMYGDIVLAVNGVTASSAESARDALFVSTSEGEVMLEIDRNGEMLTLSMQPSYLETLESEGYGVALVEMGLLSYPLWLVPWKAIQVTIGYTLMILVAFWDLIVGLVTQSGVAESVSGPVGIAKMTGQVAQMGWVYLLQFTALLSINLAVLNILPFPALDGGRVLFVLVEAVRRKPASPKLEALVHNTGFLLLIAFVLFVTYRDIVNLL
jgi:regulator of sigma E protease